MIEGQAFAKERPKADTTSVMTIGFTTSH